MARRLVFACQFAVGKTAARDLRHGDLESLRVIRRAILGSAIVVTEYLFVNVFFEMKRLNSNVGSLEAALQQRPEILHTVDMDLTSHVCLSLVNEVMHEAPLQAVVVGYRVIGVDLGSVLHVFKNLILQGLALDVRHDGSANFAETPVKDALHDGLVEVRPERIDAVLRLGVAVHVLNLAADERLVNFNFGLRPAHLRRRAKRTIVQCSAEPLKHEPCRLLGNAKCAVNLHARHAILAVDQHPEARHPLVEANRRILKDRVDLERELLVAAPAEPDAARLDEVVRFRTATRAMDLAVRPAQANGIVESPLRIGEVNDGLL